MELSATADPTKERKVWGNTTFRNKIVLFSSFGIMCPWKYENGGEIQGNTKGAMRGNIDLLGIIDEVATVPVCLGR